MTAADIAVPLVPSDISLSWLEHALGELRPVRGSAEIEDTLQFVRSIAEPALVRALLAEVRSDEALLQRIASRSYRHVNHFDKIVLVDSPRTDSYRLTLHLWEPPYSASELDDELIHDHRFSFWSSVLTGELVSQNFLIVDAEPDDKFRQYQYRPQTNSAATTANSYKYLGPAGLRSLPPSLEAAGGAYYLSFDSVHRVVLPQVVPTCTLVLRGPREREFSNVFNTAYPSYDTDVSNIMFTPAELKDKLDRVYHRVTER